MPHSSAAASAADSFPNPYIARSEAGDVASILSSRMTDIASDDGGEHTADPTTRSTGQSADQRRSTQTAPGEAISHRNAADGPKDPLRAEGLFLVLLPNEEVYLEVSQARTLVGHRVLLVEHMYRPSLRTHFFAQ
jgi:hypothetical protein